MIRQLRISLPVQFLSNPAEGLQIPSQVGMGDPLVDRDHFLDETEGLSIFSSLFMDQDHIVGGNRDSQKVAQSLEQILGPRITSISSIQVTQSPLNKTESVQRDSHAHAVSNHLMSASLCSRTWRAWYQRPWRWWMPATLARV